MRIILASIYAKENILDHLASFLVVVLQFVVVKVVEMVVFRPLGAIFDIICSFSGVFSGKTGSERQNVVNHNLLETLLFILLPLILQLVTRLLGAYNFYILSYCTTRILRIMVA